MKRFNADIVTCSEFHSHCYFYISCLKKFHSALHNHRFVYLFKSSLCDVLVNIGSELTHLAHSRVAHSITEEEYNYLCDKFYNLKYRVIRLISSN